METDVIFSVFDVQKGPMVLYTSLDSLEEAQKIAVRSYIAIGAMEEDQDLRGRQAVVPLPSLSKLAFYYMFKVEAEDKDSGKKVSSWATIGYINDSSSSIDFYRSMPIIQEKMMPIIELIQKNFIFSGEKSEVNSIIISSIDSLKSPVLPDVSETISLVAMPDKDTEAVPFEDFRKGDLTFLFEYFPEDLGKVVYSLMLEEPVLIIGDIKDIVQKVVASLEFLVPHRLLTKKYATTYLDPKGQDLLICSSHVNFLKKYRNITNINVVTRQISSRIKGVPSIQNLINTLKIAPSETQKTVIKSYINNLLAKTAELMSLCEKDQVSREEITNFRSNLNSDELNIVISMVRSYAHQFEDKLFYFARSII
ncbi:MAG: hypothetical protein ACFE95_09195 [Candidatus Hodarchaeota archaeon]